MLRNVLGALGLSVIALVLSSCGQSGLDLAKEACADVHQSIVYYDEGLRAHNQVARAHDLQNATVELQKAEPLAASATSADGRWNALMTTLTELGQVDEGHLVEALRAQCSAVSTTQPGY